MAADDTGMEIDDPMFLFTLFQSDVIAAEIDWSNERFLFYPVRTEPEPMR